MYVSGTKERVVNSGSPRVDHAIMSRRGESELGAPVQSPPRSLAKLLRTFGAMRLRRDLTADEALIFLALGYLGVSQVDGCVRAMPVACLDVSDLLRIPRETVRRKVARLAKKDLVSITSHGVFVENIAEWRRLSDDFAT
jgi:hypothetical protein